MENVFPIIALVVYLFFTMITRRKKQEMAAEARKQKLRQGTVPGTQPESGSPETRKRTPIPEMDDYFSRIANRVKKEARGSLLDQIITSFDEGAGIVEDAPVVIAETDQVGSIKTTASIIPQVEQPPVEVANDIAVSADTKIKEAQSVFKAEMSEMPIGVYAVNESSYLISKSDVSAAEFLQQEFNKRSMLEQGILMAEILGKPVALKSSAEY